MRPAEPLVREAATVTLPVPPPVPSTSSAFPAGSFEAPTLPPFTLSAWIPMLPMTVPLSVMVCNVVAVAKRVLRAGEVLDGEGGFCVWGRQGPALRSLAEGLLPLGLAHNVRLRRDVAVGASLSYADVALDPDGPALRARREMEVAFGRDNAG